jgi:hypothetical protein
MSEPNQANPTEYIRPVWWNAKSNRTAQNASLFRQFANNGPNRTLPPKGGEGFGFVESVHIEENRP